MHVCHTRILILQNKLLLIVQSIKIKVRFAGNKLKLDDFSSLAFAHRSRKGKYIVVQLFFGECLV